MFHVFKNQCDGMVIVEFHLGLVKFSNLQPFQSRLKFTLLVFFISVPVILCWKGLYDSMSRVTFTAYVSSDPVSFTLTAWFHCALMRHGVQEEEMKRWVEEEIVRPDILGMTCSSRTPMPSFIKPPAC